ncbi:MAG TPA: serine/threonine-protein kinase, partial [Rhodocyclaceae bacterium]|nr:serine/threonine-protein kinase [Rhodocyclaceae bacterium]
MRGSRFWKADWFFGLILTLLMLAALPTDFVRSLERQAYDWGVQASSRTPSDRIAVIAIDEASIANLGRWPWPRDLHAKLTDLLVGAKVKIVANTVFFSEPQRDPGYDYITRLIDLYLKLNVVEVPADPAADPSAPPAVSLRYADIAPLGGLLQEAEVALNTDRRLAESYEQAGRVLLPMLFELGVPHGKPDQAMPEFIARNRLAKVGGDGGINEASGVIPPIEALGGKAVAIGHLNTNADVDGGIRREALVVKYYDQFYPSFALAIAAASLNLKPADVQVDLGRDVRLANLRIPTNQDTEMLTYFYPAVDGRPAFAVDSFYDVIAGKIPAAKYQDKIVLIGATAAGVGATQVTPVSAAMPPVLTLAHAVSSILKEHFFVAPSWGVWAEIAVFVLIALYLTLLLPRLSAGIAALATLGLATLLLGAHFGLMVGPGIWLQLMGALCLLLVGHLLLTTKRFLITERGKEVSDAQSAESNRMLALAFQGQGQLDMAWDKFRQVPLSDGVMDNLYNLALDFERKRQFNKAETVFRHMAGYNPKYKDLDQKMSRAKQMSETVILGGASGHPGGTMQLGAGTEKPMLGRYQVEKELGKGAMGVVYMGRDPKINRIVAIKTMALAQEFEPDELADVKARFFREAETAGRLNHPNIVTMFDAGEEHDLAYIAMEFLKGHDLVPYTKVDALLPLPQVMSIVARVADALDYAHRNQVVHRDIKPANVMYEPASDQVKVTDFGIARITDSSKTKTGMVLGTPSYMSPEQLIGKKIDGRSDIFSLGVSLYQLASGHLPFVGESMAQLMFKIANDPAPDVRGVRPDAPACLAGIIERAMAKDVEQRYRTGAE